MKKVLIINHSLQQGGIVRSLISALNCIDYSKYEITLYLHLDRPDLIDLIPENVNIITNHDKNHYYRKPKSLIYSAQKEVLKLIGKKEAADKCKTKLDTYVRSMKVNHAQKDYLKNYNFDVVIAYSVDMATEIALTVPAEKHYAFYHSSKPDFHRDITEICFPQFDKIVAVSEGVKQVVNEGFPNLRDKTVCISNFTDLAYLKEQAKLFNPCENAKGTVLCSCGRLSHEKGYDMAVEAAKILRDRGADFTWYFVGDGAEREKLEAKISEYGLNENIVITGFLTNPYPYIANADIFIQPSYEEAQPLSVLEALRLGTPIVSTDTVGGQVILEGGKKGIITDINAPALAQGIYSLITDEAKRKSFANLYSEGENESEKKEFTEKWDKLLSL